jgi:hypothetical protein
VVELTRQQRQRVGVQDRAQLVLAEAQQAQQAGGFVGGGQAAAAVGLRQRAASSAEVRLGRRRQDGVTFRRAGSRRRTRRSPTRR